MMPLHVFIPLATPILFVVPTILIVAFAIMMIPSLNVQGSRPEEVAKAIGCVILKLVGTVLVVISSVQFIESLLKKELLPLSTFGILCIIFGVGAVLMSAASQVVHGVNRASAIVPRSIALSLVITIASLSFVSAFLFFTINAIITGNVDQWQLPGAIVLVSIIVALYASLKLSHLHATREKTIFETIEKSVVTAKKVVKRGVAKKK